MPYQPNNMCYFRSPRGQIKRKSTFRLMDKKRDGMPRSVKGASHPGSARTAALDLTPDCFSRNLQKVAKFIVVAHQGSLLADLFINELRLNDDHTQLNRE